MHLAEIAAPRSSTPARPAAVIAPAERGGIRPQWGSLAHCPTKRTRRRRTLGPGAGTQANTQPVDPDRDDDKPRSPRRERRRLRRLRRRRLRGIRSLRAHRCVSHPPTTHAAIAV